MARNFQAELSEIKTRYEESILLVSQASSSLGDLFSRKMVKMKSKISRFLAQAEIRISQTNKEMRELAQVVNSLLSNTGNNNQAQMFAFKELLQQLERDQESQTAKQTSALKHLVTILQSLDAE